MGICTSTDRHNWLASQTLHNYIHNTAVYSQTPPHLHPHPPPGNYQLPGGGQAGALGEAAPAAEWAEKAIKQLFLWTRVAVGDLVWEGGGCRASLAD